MAVGVAVVVVVGVAVSVVVGVVVVVVVVVGVAVAVGVVVGVAVVVVAGVAVGVGVAMTDTQDIETELKKISLYYADESPPFSPCDRQEAKDIYWLTVQLRASLAREKIAIEALEFYADKSHYDRANFLVLGDVFREDLAETDWSRFTPGKKAREALKKIGGMK